MENSFKLTGEQHIIFNDNVPGGLSSLCSIQSKFYARAWGFGFKYESVMAAGVSEFLSRYDKNKDFVRILTQENEVVGGVVIDHKDGETGQLRWFYLSDHLRGFGLGKKVFDEAMNFIRNSGLNKVYLNTFQGLDKARVLYEQAGFRLEREQFASTWGKDVIEQVFEWQK